jgi:hypothetical protein
MRRGMCLSRSGGFVEMNDLDHMHHESCSTPEIVLQDYRELSTT